MVHRKANHPKVVRPCNLQEHYRFQSTSCWYNHEVDSNTGGKKETTKNAAEKEE